jgi:hypothetical protein
VLAAGQAAWVSVNVAAWVSVHVADNIICIAFFTPMKDEILLLHLLLLEANTTLLDSTVA